MQKHNIKNKHNWNWKTKISTIIQLIKTSGIFLKRSNNIETKCNK